MVFVLAFVPILAITTVTAHGSTSHTRAERRLDPNDKKGSCDYSCPKKSKSSVYCPETFEDCECSPGFIKDGETCVCNTECPANSKARGHVDCPRNIQRHCKCDRGFKLDGKECICASPTCAAVCDEDGFTCPAFSQPRNFQECANDMSDCDCLPGYKEEEGACVCDSKCPRNARLKKNIECPTNIQNHCICRRGFVFEDNKCEPVCESNFNCPEKALPLVSCPSSFADCECVRGYREDGNGGCSCDRTCPENAWQKKSVDCPLNTRRHCVCDAGFKWAGKICEPDCEEGFECPVHSSPVLQPACNLYNCQCDDGFKWENSECIAEAPVQQIPGPEQPTPLIYEPFGDAVSFGFADGSEWLIQGNLDANFDAPPLNYQDAEGNELQCAGGALSVTGITQASRVSRRATKTLWPAMTPFWVSFLLRLDSDVAGDAFWAPFILRNEGGAGFQGGNLRLVDKGPLSGVTVETGTTYLIVVHVQKEPADLWVNPVLTNPGEATARFDVALPADLNEVMFRFSQLNNGAYTVDEFRLGFSFEEVTPRKEI